MRAFEYVPALSRVALGVQRLDVLDMRPRAAQTATSTIVPVGPELAFEVDDCDAAAAQLAANGGMPEAPPVDTPWGDRNVRVVAPDGMQLTLFTVPRE